MSSPQYQSSLLSPVKREKKEAEDPDDYPQYPEVVYEEAGPGLMTVRLLDPQDGTTLACWQEEAAVGAGPRVCSELNRFDPYSIYIGGLAAGTTQEDLARHFLPLGEILRVTLLRCRTTGQTSGSAYINYRHIQSAEEALLLDQSFIHGQCITVKKKLLSDKEQQGRRGEEHQDEGDVDPYSVYVGNLPVVATSLQLASHFHTLGRVSKLTLLRDKVTGASKGAAYIMFPERHQATAALALHGSRLAGNIIKVVKKKKQWVGEQNNNLTGGKLDLMEAFPELEDCIDGHEPTSVFVGNINLDTTTEELSELFKETGEVKRVTILKDKLTGKPKPAAYIEFTESWAVEEALGLNGALLKGNELKVRRKRKAIL